MVCPICSEAKYDQTLKAKLEKNKSKKKQQQTKRQGEHGGN